LPVAPIHKAFVNQALISTTHQERSSIKTQWKVIEKPERHCGPGFFDESY